MNDVRTPGSRRNQHKTVPRKDKKDDKRYPNSIAMTVVAIVKSFLHTSDPDRHSDNDMSYVRFLEESNFSEIYASTLEKYPGIKDPPIKLKDMLQKIGGGKDKGLSYFQIRALADYLDLPVSLFFLFTHLVSIERRIDDLHQRRQAFLQLIEGIRRVLGAAESAIVNNDEEIDDWIFTHIHNERDGIDIWIADVVRLVEWCEHYNEGDLSLVKEALEKP